MAVLRRVLQAVDGRSTTALIVALAVTLAVVGAVLLADGGGS